MNIADPLSRLVMSADDEEVAGEQYIRSIILLSHPVAVSWNELIDESIYDTETQRVLEAMEEDDWSLVSMPYRAVKEELCEYPLPYVRRFFNLDMKVT